MNRSCPRNFLAKGAPAPYLVRMIKPNLIASHDWHVQPICQRSLRATRLGETLWIEARTRVRPKLAPGMSSNLIAHCPILPLAQQASAFWREPFKAIKTVVTGQGKNSSEPSGQPVRAAQNIKERPAKSARATRARGRSSPGSCNGLFSLGVPYRGPGVKQPPHLTQRTSSITLASHFPQRGRPYRLLRPGPPGGSTAHSLLD